MDPADLQAVRLRMLHQIVEELVLTERARELGLSVSEAALETKIASIRKDYPDAAFDRTLLQNAVFYGTWRQRLRQRMLMEMVITRELGAQTAITGADLERHRRRQLALQHRAPGAGNRSDAGDFATVRRLKQKKVLSAYPRWIQQLMAKYRIEINQARWEEIKSK